MIFTFAEGYRVEVNDSNSLHFGVDIPERYIDRLKTELCSQDWVISASHTQKSRISVYVSPIYVYPPGEPYTAICRLCEEVMGIGLDMDVWGEVFTPSA
jgi:hypothetical protein